MPRGLTDFEIAEVRAVFDDRLDYARIRVVEDATWTNRLARVWQRILRQPPPTYDTAVTLGATLYFPRPLRTQPEAFRDSGWGDFGWLVHELTHAWQNQRHPVRAALKSVWAHVSQGTKAYKYGGEAALAQARLAGKTLADFNAEQQGEITRDYFMRRKLGSDVSAWEPFIDEIRCASTA